MMYSVAGAFLPRSSSAAIGCSRHFSKTLIHIPSPSWWNHQNRTIVRSYNLKPMASISTAVSEAEKPKPWLLVGLGNPGKIYSGTRHNVGFELIDFIAEAEGIPMSGVSFKSIFGKAVGAIVSYYKVPLKQVLVILDDMDLPFAKLRLLPKGGHAGHNGMKSIMNHLKGSQEFPRLRIGIGRPPGKMDPANFVLRPFNREEIKELDFTFQTGLEAVRILVLENFNKSATFVNSAKSFEKL